MTGDYNPNENFRLKKSSYRAEAFPISGSTKNLIIKQILTIGNAVLTEKCTTAYEG